MTTELTVSPIDVRGRLKKPTVDFILSKVK